MFFLSVITLRKAEVLVNESTFITCFSTKVKRIQWHHTPPGKSNEYVYAGGQFYSSYSTGRFQVDNHLTSNMYTLVITNIMLEDAGLYECKDDVESGVFDSTHLTVLGNTTVGKYHISLIVMNIIYYSYLLLLLQP